MIDTQNAHCPPVVALLTDFGLRDGFVGVMKGVILSRAPAAKIIDISHDVQPFDVPSAAFLLDWSFPYLPRGSVITVVIDPGVGTLRDILVLDAFERRFVFPDNGVISRVWSQECQERRLVCAKNRSLWLDMVSSTFHGRDIFSPLAAHLANGGELSEIGPTVESPSILLPPCVTEVDESQMIGEIEYIDRFGNLVTTIRRETLLDWIEGVRPSVQDVIIRLGSIELRGIAPSYGAVAEGEPVAVFDGYDRLEIAVNQERADRILDVRIGDRVSVAVS